MQINKTKLSEYPQKNKKQGRSRCVLVVAISLGASSFTIIKFLTNFSKQDYFLK